VVTLDDWMLVAITQPSDVMIRCHDWRSAYPPGLIFGFCLLLTLVMIEPGVDKRMLHPPFL